jgi:hypothetical protein
MIGGLAQSFTERPELVIRDCSRLGPGARGILIVVGSELGIGHALNLINLDGTATLIDRQFEIATDDLAAYLRHVSQDSPFDLVGATDLQWKFVPTWQDQDALEDN